MQSFHFTGSDLLITGLIQKDCFMNVQFCSAGNI